MTLFIGDVHGKFGSYRRIMRYHLNTIQVGDMGIGFFEPYTGRPYANPPCATMRKGGHRFIRGNHDNPKVCEKHSQYIHDGCIEGDVMFIGGAMSIDREVRVKDYTWWEDEELSSAALSELVQKYQTHRPKVMVTHDCPQGIVEHVCIARGRPFVPDFSITRDALQRMWFFHQPEIWIFGHWHTSLDKTINGTRFVCLNELETKEIEVGLI
jgi:Icc-related predicted phosphoesterase